MGRKPFNPSESGETENESDHRPKMADILILPEIEQQIITQMIRQKEMSLAEIVAYTNQEEEVVSNMLNSLSKQGFVQELNSEGELRYRPRVAPKPPSKVSQNFWQELNS